MEVDGGFLSPGRTQEAAIVHEPVLLREVLELLQPAEGEFCVDTTVGSAGHAAALLGRLGQTGYLLGIDCDPEALAAARERLMPFAPRWNLRPGNFRFLPEFVSAESKGRAGLLLMDLGVSSLELDRPERGFSFARQGPLDMRMDPALPRSAADLLAKESAESLEKIFRLWGEEPEARRIARALAERRRTGPFRSTTDLAAFVQGVKRFRRRGMHPATLVFQALRIAVNREMENLQKALESFPAVLASGARAAVISFHSLEDRLVKQAFRQWKKQGHAEILTPKPVRPGASEVRRNPRSRSARLRALRWMGL